jgi:hypothetical protein
MGVHGIHAYTNVPEARTAIGCHVHFCNSSRPQQRLKTTPIRLINQPSALTGAA